MNRRIIILICLLSLLLMVLLVLYPKYQELTLWQSQIREKEKEIKFRGNYLDELAEASNIFKEHEEQIAIIDSGLPDSPSLPTLFDFIQKTGAQSGLVVQDLGVSSPKSGEESEKRLEEISISVGANGSYEAIKEFLVILEKSARMFDITSFSIQVGEESIFSLSLTAKTYSY